MKKPSFEISADARLLYQRLLQVPEGGFVAYSDLTAVISRSVGGNTSALHTALRLAKREDGIVFGNIRGAGYRRLTPSEVVKAVRHGFGRIRRSVKREATTLYTVKDFDKLTTEEKAQHAASATALSMLHEATSQKSLSTIQKAVEQNGGREMAVAATLKLFASKD